MGAFVGDDAGEDVEATSRAPRVRPATDPGRKMEPFPERDQVRPVLLEHCSVVGEIQLVHAVFAELVANWTGARQKAATEPVGDVAEGQVEARGLDVPFGDTGR